ncbi:MAG TPA: hypothetical protein VGM14_15225 [Streptosporangiaceae bacterium]
MRGERVLVNQIRELMEPGNPAPATGCQGEVPYQEEIAALLAELRSAPPELTEPVAADPVPVDPAGDRPGRRRGRGTAWRVLAPVLSGLAVVAVVTGLTIAAGQGPARRGGGPLAPVAASLPQFYVTVNRYPPHQKVIVHSTKTGKAVGSVELGSRPGEFLKVAATGSGRVFYIVADAALPRHGTTLHRMTLSMGGHHIVLHSLPSSLLARFDEDEINAIAVSPDGRRLGVAVQVPHRLSLPRAQMAVVPLDGKGATHVWSAPSDQAFALDPAWTDNHHLAFLWQDRLTGPISNFTGRTQVRQLDTTGSGTDLLSSKVLITSHVGFIQTAFATPHGGPILATIFNNKPATGTHGVATSRLVEFDPHHAAVLTILGIRNAHYSNPTQRDNADIFFLVYGIDASGQNALVAAPHFGILSQRKISKLPAGSGELFGAAW